MKFQFVMESRRRKCNLLILFLSRTLDIVEIKYMKYIYLNHGFGSNICIWYIARLYSFFMSIYFNSSGIGKEERNDRPPQLTCKLNRAQRSWARILLKSEFFPGFFFAVVWQLPLNSVGLSCITFTVLSRYFYFLYQSLQSRERCLSAKLIPKWCFYRSGTIRYLAISVPQISSFKTENVRLKNYPM